MPSPVLVHFPFFLTRALSLSPLALLVSSLRSGHMPGKGWSCILDTALAFAGQEASNDGKSTMPDLVAHIRRVFAAQVENAMTTIATENNVSVVKWEDYAVNSMTQEEAIQDKLSGKDASIWQRYKTILAACRKYTSYYRTFMTSSTNDSPPSGKKKAECLEYVMKCARQQELLEADLAKRKKVEKKKAKQAKAAAEAPAEAPAKEGAAAHLPVDVDTNDTSSTPMPTPMIPPLPKQAASAFRRGAGKGSRLSSGSVGTSSSSTSVPAPAGAAPQPPSVLSGIARLGRQVFQALSPTKATTGADEEEDEEEDDEEEEHGEEGEEEEAGLNDDISLDQPKATSLDDIELEPTYLPFSWYFWLSKGPLGVNIEDLQTEAGGEDFEGIRAKSSKGSRRDARARKNLPYPDAAGTQDSPGVPSAAAGKRKAAANTSGGGASGAPSGGRAGRGGGCSGGRSGGRSHPRSGLGGARSDGEEEQEQEPEDEQSQESQGFHGILEQGDHIVSQMNYSNRQAAHERLVAQHMGKIEMLKVRIATMKDMDIADDEVNALKKDLLELLAVQLPDPPSPYQEPPPRKRPRHAHPRSRDEGGSSAPEGGSNSHTGRDAGRDAEEGGEDDCDDELGDDGDGF